MLYTLYNDALRMGFEQESGAHSPTASQTERGGGSLPRSFLVSIIPDPNTPDQIHLEVASI